MATTLGLVPPKKPNREQVKTMGDLVYSRMAHGGARILTELEGFITIVKEIAAKGMERAKLEDQAVGCKYCGKKPDSGYRLALDAAMVGRSSGRPSLASSPRCRTASSFTSSTSPSPPSGRSSAERSPGCW